MVKKYRAKPQGHSEACGFFVRDNQTLTSCIEQLAPGGGKLRSSDNSGDVLVLLLVEASPCLALLVLFSCSSLSRGNTAGVTGAVAVQDGMPWDEAVQEDRVRRAKQAGYPTLCIARALLEVRHATCRLCSSQGTT